MVQPRPLANNVAGTKRRSPRKRDHTQTRNVLTRSTISLNGLGNDVKRCFAGVAAPTIGKGLEATLALLCRAPRVCTDSLPLLGTRIAL